MRIYLELREVPPERSYEEPDFIRIDVTEWSAEDVDALIELLEEHAGRYSHAVIVQHFCRHEEQERCHAVMLKEIRS